MCHDRAKTENSVKAISSVTMTAIVGSKTNKDQLKDIVDRTMISDVVCSFIG